MPPLSPTQRRALRAKAHHLHPVVIVGQQGLTPRVLHEIDVALTAHELVKIRVFAEEREQRAAMLERICAESGCAPVQHLGKMLIVWRPGEKEQQPAARTPRSPMPVRKGSHGPPSRGADPRALAPGGVHQRPPKTYQDDRRGGAGDAGATRRGARSQPVDNAGVVASRRRRGAGRNAPVESTGTYVKPRPALGDRDTRRTPAQQPRPQDKRSGRGAANPSGAQRTPSGQDRTTSHAGPRAPKGVPGSGMRRRRRAA